MPIKYIPFTPEPIEGQAVLNFKRLLKYRGIDDLSYVIERGMPYYEVEKKETVGENKDGNMVIRGECVSACAYLKEKGVQVNLVYIDPPFASGADYAKKIYIRRNPKVAAAIAKAEEEAKEEEIDSDELKAFEEKMYGDVWDKEKYLNWMYENLLAIKSVMSETASIYVHLDQKIGHYIKVLMDEIFSEDNFRNEIIWSYTGGSAPGGDFSRKHDTIFRYSKSSEYTFHNVYEEYSETTLRRFDKIDSDGRRYKLTYFNNIPHKSYMKEGKALEDVWQISKSSDQSLGYAFSYVTQKPERLLNYIIKASSDENMIVADFFAGSGVTAAVASKLKRRFITSDIGINSIQTTRDRLKADGAKFDVLEIKDGVRLYRNPVQTMEKVKSLIHGLKNEDSLGEFWAGAISDSKLGTVPVYIPNLMDSGTKLLDKVLINRIIHQAIPELDGDIKKVVVYYVDITSVEEIKKFIADDDSTTVEIELKDLKAVLDDVIVEDYAEYGVDENTENLLGGYVVTVKKFMSDRVLKRIDEFNQKSFAAGKKLIEISDEGLETIEFLSLDCTAAEGEWHSDSEVKIDRLGYVIKDGIKTKEFWDGAIRSDKRPLRLKIRNICGDESVWKI